MNRKVRILLVLMVLVAQCAVGAVNEPLPVPPPFLKEGDKIAVLSPSGAHTYNIVDSACAVFGRWGYQGVIGPNVGARWHGFAGTVEQRKNDLLWALRDTTVRAIMCADGGYGVINMLCEVPMEEFRNNPKWIIGYSDITGLLSAQVRAGNMAIHGNMCYWLRKTHGTDRLSQILREILTGEFPGYVIRGHKYNVKGTAQGILLGGNISVFTDLAGSDYDFLAKEFIADKDVILFFEDTNEDMPHVDRMLQQLRIRGIINHVKGVIVGRFKGYSPTNGWSSMYELLNHYFKDSSIPVCYDFPTGHFADQNYPLIEGCPVTLTVEADSVTLDFNNPITITKSN